MKKCECKTEEVLRAELVHFSRLLSKLGFTPGTAGNLSVRLDSHKLLVTPSGLAKRVVKSSDMVVVDLEGKLLTGSRKVTSEICMHLAVYEQRADVNAVVHSHPPIATAFACSGRPLDEFLCQEAIMTIGAVPLACFATTGTAEVAASIQPFIAGHEAILLGNHGAISYGVSLRDAFMKMEIVEHLAHVALVAHQLGSARPLAPDQVRHLQGARSKYIENIQDLD